MRKEKEAVIMICMICICCMIMSAVDAIIQPDYAVKSAIKLVVFLLCPTIYANFGGKIELKGLFRWKKQAMKSSALLATGLYIAIVGAYFIEEFFLILAGLQNESTIMKNSHLGLLR